MQYGNNNKRVVWPLNRVVHLFLFFLLWISLVNLKFIKNQFLKENSFFFQKPIFFWIDLMIGWKFNNKKTPFLGVDCPAGLEIEGKMFQKI